MAAGRALTPALSLRERERRPCGGVEQGVELFHVHALHQVLVGLDGRHVGRVVPVFEVGAGERLHFASELGQDRGQVAGQGGEGVHQHRADLLQAGVVGGVFGQVPGFVLVHIGVHAVGQCHDFAHGLAVFALVVLGSDAVCGGADVMKQGRALIVKRVRQLAAKTLGDEAGRARHDVDKFAHQIAVDPQHEVFGVEVHVFVAAGELGGHVVAQPLGVHAQFQVLQRRQAGAPALAHLLAVVDGQEAVHKHRVGHFAAAEMQHGRPKQGVEGDDVFADEVVLLGGRVGHEGVVVATGFAEVVLQRGQIANRRVQPDVEILARGVGNLNAEIGRVAADVPIAHLGFAVFAGGDPFGDFVEHLGLHRAAGGPLLQKFDAARVGQFEEEVVRGLEHRCGARECGIRVLQLGRGIDRAAAFAVVAVLVLRAALGAFALDEAVGQEHALLGVEELLDGAGLDQVVGLEVFVDLLRQGVVFRAVGAVPVVKADVKAVEVLGAAGGDVGHKLLRGFAGFFSRDHDRRAVGVVGADKVHLVALHALKAHPHIGLDVFHDVADVEVAVGVGQGGGDEQAALAHGVGR